MGPAAARNAQGTTMVAGLRSLFESVQADLARMTGCLEYMGERRMAALPLVAARMDRLIVDGHSADDFCVLGVDAVQPARK